MRQRRKKPGKLVERPDSSLAAQRLHHRIHILADITQNAGTATLMSFWEMYRTGLWMEFVPEGPEGQPVGDYTFYDYVTDYHSHLSRGYLGDMARIIMRTFQRCHSQRIILPDTGERVTPELIVQKATIMAIRKVTQKLAFAETDEEVVKLIVALGQGTDADDIERQAGLHLNGSSQELPEYTAHLNSQGTWDIQITGLNDRQLNLFRQLVGMYAQEKLA